MFGIHRFSDIDDFINWIKRKLGAPTLKVELTRSQIIDCINESVDAFVRGAEGQSTEDNFYTLMLSGGQSDYELPEGVLDVINFTDSGCSEGGINTLFTIENQMYNAGLIDPKNFSSGMSLLNYHLALDYIEVIDHYTNLKYIWKYNSFKRILSITPTPANGNLNLYNPDTGKQEIINSPGWVLLQLKTLPGAMLPGWTMEDSFLEFYNAPWVKKYALALAKIVLGEVREKFESYSSVGNTGITLNGAQLKSEGTTEKEQLEEKLVLEESYTGYGISTGIVV